MELALSSTNAVEHLSLPYDPASGRLFGVPVVATVSQAAGVGHVLARDAVVLDTDTQGIGLQWSETSNTDDFAKNLIRAGMRRHVLLRGRRDRVVEAADDVGRRDALPGRGALLLGEHVLAVRHEGGRCALGDPLRPHLETTDRHRHIAQPSRPKIDEINAAEQTRRRLGHQDLAAVAGRPSPARRG